MESIVVVSLWLRAARRHARTRMTVTHNLVLLRTLEIAYCANLCTLIKDCMHLCLSVHFLSVCVHSFPDKCHKTVKFPLTMTVTSQHHIFHQKNNG